MKPSRAAYSLLLASVLLAAEALNPMPPDKAMPLAKDYCAKYLRGDITGLWPKMSPELQKLLKSPEEGAATMNKVFSQLGHEAQTQRSEERRVGTECRYEWW